MARSASSAKHIHLVSAAVDWLRLEYGCGIILSEQYVLWEKFPTLSGGKGSIAQSLLNVEVRIEPQTITDFLKWKNRMAEYNARRRIGPISLIH